MLKMSIYDPVSIQSIASTTDEVPTHHYKNLYIGTL